MVIAIILFIRLCYWFLSADYCFSVLHGEFAAAVLLVVEAILAEQLVTAFLQAALAPVACPEAGAGNGLLGHKTVTTTQIYTKVLDEGRKKAVDAIPLL